MLRNNLHYALLAVVRRWRRNLLTVLAMLAGTTTIIMLVGVSESSALNTSSQLAELRFHPARCAPPAANLGYTGG